MSFGIAVRNPEGVLLAADTLCGDTEGRDFIAGKIRFLRDHRAACLLFPVEGETNLLASEWNPDSAREGCEIRTSVLMLFQESVPVLQRYFGQLGDVHHSWRTPQILVAGFDSASPLLLRMTEGELEEDPGGAVGVMVLGAWSELHDAGERLAVVSFDALRTMERATRLVREVMASYIADYDRVAAADGRERRIGGPIDIAVIRRDTITMERHGRERAA